MNFVVKITRVIWDLKTASRNWNRCPSLYLKLLLHEFYC